MRGEGNARLDTHMCSCTIAEVFSVAIDSIDCLNKTERLLLNSRHTCHVGSERHAVSLDTGNLAKA